MPDVIRLQRQNSVSTWPTTFKCKFIVPGLVAYDDYGTVLVRKEVLDAMAQTFVGKPVINVVHKDVAPDIYENAEADGIVTRVWYDSADGWFWCEFIVWDESTQYNCRSNAYSVSCAYDVSNFKSEKGSFNNVPYEQEVLSGSYTHLAIVANPRYEDARIVVLNSKGGSDMKLKFWEKNKTELKNVGAETIVDVDGKGVSIKAMIEAHNAKKSMVTISDDTTIEIDGQEIKISELKNSYRDSLKNADEESDEDKKKKAENEADEKKKEDERKNAEDEEKKKKDAEDLKNAEEEEKKKKDKDEMENSLKLEKGTKHFNDLKKAAELRGEPQEIKVTTQRERVSAGRQKYGSAA